MIDEQKILAIIPARGGSKGILRKNIVDVAGKPLIAWTIESAQHSKYLDRCIVSSEDAEIIRIAKEYGADVPFVRPKHLSEDETSGIDPVLHALEEIQGYDYVVLLQATSPLRTTEDIDACIELCLQKPSPACVSVTQPEKHPYWMYRIDKKNHLAPLFEAHLTPRRQDLPEVYALNGAIYVAQTSWLKESQSFISPETLAYVMPSERSFDIDTKLDMMFCELLLKQQTKE